MITPAYVREMAEYNRWMNDGIYAAAGELTDEKRKEDAGGFFGSIHATLNHLLWGDQIWMSRFAQTPAPLSPDIPGSVAQYDDFEMLQSERKAFDGVIIDWAADLDAAWFDGDLTWYSGGAERILTRPKALLVTHLFNHQTHHRGQVHAMLTRAGIRTETTDLALMSL
ncbi:MAG: DinB family protein [Hyphomicrobiaceae bacterium]